MASTPNDYSGGTDSGGLITEQVKQGTQQVVQQTQQAANQAIEGAKGQAQGMLQSRKSEMTGNLNTMAQALRQTGESLRMQNQEPVANMTDNLAQRIEGVANYFDQRDIGSLISEAESYARQNPIVVVGGAFLLGVAAARFLKSSSQPSGNPGGYGGYGRYGTTYGSGYSQSTSGAYYNRDYGSVAGGYNSGYSSYETPDISSYSAYETPGVTSYGATSELSPAENFATTGAYTTDSPDVAAETLGMTETISDLETDDGTTSRSH
jgi:ElaB/YqjD/DUF883 family membrane-anchored ribosome-binding protein